ncbi:uncharacterized protein LOC131843159 isoform X2 [Achroia grisella]|uniref:uncharacterized protein LOC131843159 isoform X2 n=1 Tax=Achroia grisella TaxID=688607 RepID=UPI0027D24ACB|nr:uncharacterized protein LOC131843159 isoform X2 [Achroia grisella]
MVETRSKTNSVANLMAVEVGRPYYDHSEQSRRVWPASTTTVEDVSASLARTVAHTADASISVQASSCCTKRSSDTTSSCRVDADISLSHKTKSCYRNERSRISRSSAIVRAQKLAVEAELLRCRVARQRELVRLQAEREQKLARLEFEAEQRELEAKLAALDAKDKSAHRSSRPSIRDTKKRTATWVSEHNATMTMVTHVNIPGKEPTVTLDDIQGTPLQPAILSNTVPSHVPHVNYANELKPTRIIEDDNCATLVRLPAVELPLANPAPQLTPKISSSSNYSKKPNQSSYETTKRNYSTAENLTRLYNAFRGPAYEIVASLLRTSREPWVVMSALEQAYVRSEYITTRVIGKLRKTPELSSPESRNFQSVTKIKLLSQLSLLNENKQLLYNVVQDYLIKSHSTVRPNHELYCHKDSMHWTKYLYFNTLKLYDPYGLLKLIVISGRIVLQKMCEISIYRDSSKISQNYNFENKENWFTRSQSATNIPRASIIPRWLQIIQALVTNYKPALLMTYDYGFDYTSFVSTEVCIALQQPHFIPQLRWLAGALFFLVPSLFGLTENASNAEETALGLKPELVRLFSCVPLPDPPWLRVLQGVGLFRLKLSRPIALTSKLFLDGTTFPSRLCARDDTEAQKTPQQAEIDNFPEERKAKQPVPSYFATRTGTRRKRIRLEVVAAPH